MLLFRHDDEDERYIHTYSVLFALKHSTSRHKASRIVRLLEYDKQLAYLGQSPTFRIYFVQYMSLPPDLTHPNNNLAEPRPMPRLPPSLLRHAHQIDPLLPPLVRTTRALDLATQELSWLRTHAHTHALPLAALVSQRARGKPLQYILRTTPFGPLTLRCGRGALIPRWETEAWTTYLASLLARDAERDGGGALCVLDLCTGSGCVGLGLWKMLAGREGGVRVVGVDSSSRALGWARRNARVVGAEVRFVRGDVLATTTEGEEEENDDHWDAERLDWDVVTCNPPYVSARDWERVTARSVRAWEPRGALVPRARSGGCDGEDGDVFYPVVVDKFLRYARRGQVQGRGKRRKWLVMEVGDLEQATRVVRMVVAKLGEAGVEMQNGDEEEEEERGKAVVEIWRDWPGASERDRVVTINSNGEEEDDEDNATTVEVRYVKGAVGVNAQIPLRGKGNARAVFVRL